MKFEKGKTYTYEEIEEIIENGIMETALDPMGEKGKKLKDEGKLKDYGHHNFIMGIESIIIFNTFKSHIMQEVN